MLCSIEVSPAKEFTINELLLSVVISACRECFLEAKKDSGQAGMTKNKHPKKIPVRDLPLNRSLSSSLSIFFFLFLMNLFPIVAKDTNFFLSTVGQKGHSTFLAMFY